MKNLSPQDIVHSLGEKGISLWTESGKLKFRATHSLSESDREVLKTNKAEIIAHLEQLEKAEKDAFPLSPIQKSYLVGRDDAYDLGGINTHYYMELEWNGTLIADRLEASWNTVIAKSDALRLVILPNGTQYVLKSVPKYSIEIITLKSAEERQEKREAWNHRLYETGKWPFFTMRISRLKDAKDIIHFDFDCMIMDAWSAKIALSQMFKLYAGEPVQWPRYSFREYCRDAAKGKRDDSEAESYWKSKADGLVAEPDLPYAKPLSEIHHHRFSRMSGSLSVEEYGLLQKRCREYRTTPAAVICTAYLKSLLEFSRDDALTVNSTLFNRLLLHEDIHSVIGDFTNIAFITLSRNAGNFLKCAQSVQREMWQLVRFHAYDGTQILKFKKNLRPMRAQMPIVITCVLEGGRKTDSDIPEGIKQINALSKTPQVALDYQVTDFDGTLSVNWDYAAPAFTPETIQKMFRANIGLLKKLLDKNWEEVA